jgi:polyisoprenoid-binding protein YceI
MRVALVCCLLLGVAAPAKAADWRVLPEHSRIGFRADFVMGGTVLRGGFDQWTATIRFDPDRLQDARIAVAIRADSARTGDREADGELRSPEWMAFRAFPEARFETIAIRRLAEGRYVAEARLTLRDITRPVTLPFELRIDDGRARMQGALMLDRVAFQIGDGPDPNGQIVSREVAVEVELLAERAP